MRVILTVAVLFGILTACTPAATPSNDAGDGGMSDAGVDGSK